MRPKGWRNDPAWIAHYQALDDARLKRQIERVKMELISQQMLEEVRQLNERRPVAKIY